MLVLLLLLGLIYGLIQLERINLNLKKQTKLLEKQTKFLELLLYASSRHVD